MSRGTALCQKVNNKHMLAQNVFRYGEYDVLAYVFGKIQKSKVWFLYSKTRETSYLQKHIHFEEIRMFL